MASKARELLLPAWVKSRKPKIEIEMQNEPNAYTTGDRIEGFVSITIVQSDLIGEPVIKLRGESRTKVERPFTYGCTRVDHVFLEVDQPLIQEHTHRSAVDNHSKHRFPFCFLVPGQLLPKACMHEKSDATIESSHTMLPPTLGDSLSGGCCDWPHDDLSTEMARICYFLQVDVLKPSPDMASREIWSSKRKAVRVIPAVPEMPHIDMFESGWHCPHKERRLRQGLLNVQSGRLIAKVLQPKAIRIHGMGGKEYGSSSTAAEVKLTFMTSEHASPPELQAIRSELQVYTFYGIKPWAKYPTLSNSGCSSYGEGRLFSRICPLVNISITSVNWNNESKSSNSEPALSKDCSEVCCTELETSTEYTASILVPVTPLKSISLVPTFHACFISRVYILQLTLSYRQSKGSLFTSTLSLQVPVQVTA